MINTSKITGRNKITGILIGVFAVLWLSFSPHQDKPCPVKIEQIPHENSTEFRAVFHNTLEHAVEGEYSMDAIKKGASGKSVSRQSGAFEAAAMEQITLATTQINISSRDDYTIVLKVFSKGALLCVDSIKVEK